MRIKGFVQFNEELRIIRNQSRKGNTREIDIVEGDPTSAKSPSSSILLNNKLGEEEFQNFMKNKENRDKIKLSDLGGVKKLNLHRKEYSMEVRNNNQKFIQKEIERLGKDNIYCEYCGEGPLYLSKPDPDMYDSKRKSVLNLVSKNQLITVDHKIPIDMNGPIFNFNNLSICCHRCNQQKGNMSYEVWMKYLQSKNLDITPTLKHVKTYEQIKDQL